MRRRALIGVAAGVSLLVAGCGNEPDAALEMLIATEGRTYEGQEVPDERIDELRREIRRYDSLVEETVDQMAHVATFQKLLADEYLRRQMYGPARDALQRALDLQPDNAILYYLAAVATARSADAAMNPGERDARLDDAQTLYDRALARDPNYKEALYGMAILVGIERDDPAAALSYVERLSALETGDVAVRFLYANLLVRVGATAQAASIYDDLASNAPSAEQRDRAATNRDALDEPR